MIRDDHVVHELRIGAPPEQVFKMFVEPERLVRWIGISADLEPRPAGRFRFEIQPGQYCEGEYVEVDPPRRLVLTWGWTDPIFDLPPGTSRVTIELSPSEGGTQLRLVHDRLPGQIRLLHDDGWSQFLGRLTAVLEGGSLPPYPSDGPAAVQQRLQTQGRGG